MLVGRNATRPALLLGAVLLAACGGGPATLMPNPSAVAHPTSAGAPAVARSRSPSARPSATALPAAASAEPSPAEAAWYPTGSMTTARVDHTATLLVDGTVLVAGGRHGDEAARSLASAELYDPATGLWAATRSMTHRRAAHSATRLEDGRVLVVGGMSSAGGDQLDSAEL